MGTNCFIANVTRQNLLFMYYVQGQAKRRQIPIPPLSQIALPDDYSMKDEQEYLVRQHAQYGMVSIDAATSSRKQVGFHQYVYSFGEKPIPGSRLQMFASGNRTILDAQGKVLRQQAAIATDDALIRTLSHPSIDPDMPTPDLGKVEISVMEDNRPDGAPAEDMVSEGYRVTAEQQPAAARAGSARGSRGARRT